MISPVGLTRVAERPSFWLWTPESDNDASQTLHGWRDARLVVRVVRGRKMRDFESMDNEFSAALQFPAYYGENWAAFDECITDLSWLPAETGYVIVVNDPLLVLDESPNDFAVLVRVLGEAASEWATPVELDEWWDRPAVPFNVVLHSSSNDAENVTARWAAAGGTVLPLA